MHSANWCKGGFFLDPLCPMLPSPPTPGSLPMCLAALVLLVRNSAFLVCFVIFFFPNTSTVDTVPSYFQCCCEFTYLLEHIKVIGTGKNACPNCILLLSGQTDRWMNRWTDTISLLTNLSKFVSRYKEYYIFLFFSLVSSSLYLPTSSSLFLSFETRSCYAAQDDHKLAIFLPQPPECQSYRCAHSHPACIF